MARPKKQPNYDAEKVMQELLEVLVSAYENPMPLEDDGSGHKQLKLLADEFSMSALKVRKLLITAEVYSTEISDDVQELFKKGKKVAEIQAITGLSRSSVNGYLPYTKVVYKADELSTDGKRIKLYRERKRAVHSLMDALHGGDNEVMGEQLWHTLQMFAGYPFLTAKGLRFTYSMKGNEMFFSRKEKSVTRSSVVIAMETALNTQKNGNRVSEPKALKCFGARYIYPVFLRIGVIKDEGKAT